MKRRNRLSTAVERLERDAEFVVRLARLCAIEESAKALVAATRAAEHARNFSASELPAAKHLMRATQQRVERSFVRLMEALER